MVPFANDEAGQNAPPVPIETRGRSRIVSADHPASAAPVTIAETVPVGQSGGTAEIGGADMKDMMTRKGYFGSARYDDEERIFFGRIEFIRALVSYEGTDVKSLRKAFEEAVDDYLDLCKEKGVEPEKPLKGSFNIRVGPELHRKLVAGASRSKMPLNRYVAELLKRSA